MAASIESFPPPVKDGAVRTTFDVSWPTVPQEHQLVARDAYPNGCAVEYVRFIGRRSGTMIYGRLLVRPDGTYVGEGW